MAEGSFLRNLGLDLPALDGVEINKRWINDYDFQRYFTIDRTSQWIEKMNWQHDHGQNMIQSFYGQQGSTKSYTGMAAVAMTKLHLDLDNLFFKLEDLEKQKPKLHAGDVVIQDEWVKVFGVGRERLDTEYALMIESLRKRQVSFFIISVMPRAVDYAFFLVNCLRLYIPKKFSIVELQDTRMETLGHLRIPYLGKLMGEKFVDAYEQKKDDFLAIVLRRKNVDYLGEWASEIIESEGFKNIEMKHKEKAEEKHRYFYGIPFNKLIEITNAAHPELRTNIEAKQVAHRIQYFCESRKKDPWQVRG